MVNCNHRKKVIAYMGRGGRAGLALCYLKPVEAVNNYNNVLEALFQSATRYILSAPFNLKGAQRGDQTQKTTRKKGGSAREGNKTSKTTPGPAVPGKDGRA